MLDFTPSEQLYKQVQEYIDNPAEVEFLPHKGIVRFHKANELLGYGPVKDPNAIDHLDAFNRHDFIKTMKLKVLSTFPDNTAMSKMFIEAAIGQYLQHKIRSGMFLLFPLEWL